MVAYQVTQVPFTAPGVQEICNFPHGIQFIYFLIYTYTYMPHILSILATLSLFIYVNQLIENGIDGTPAIALAFSLLMGIFSMIRFMSKQ